MKKKEIIKRLRSALKDAQRHLKYCGYGDNWERECAEVSGLEKALKVSK